MSASGLWAVLIGDADLHNYQAIAIVKPQAEATLFDNAGDVDVDVELTPPLRRDDGDSIVLVVDGKQAARRTQLHFELAAVERGTHTLQAMVVTREGETAIVSPVVQFYLWHGSSRFPGQRGR